MGALLTESDLFRQFPGAGLLPAAVLRPLGRPHRPQNRTRRQLWLSEGTHFPDLGPSPLVLHEGTRMLVAAPRFGGGSLDSGFVAANLNSGPTLPLLPGHTGCRAALGTDACHSSAVDFSRAGPHGPTPAPHFVLADRCQVKPVELNTKAVHGELGAPGCSWGRQTAAFQTFWGEDHITSACPCFLCRSGRAPGTHSVPRAHSTLGN